MIEIGDRIRKHRIDKGLTQKELATMIHKTKSSIEKYEAGITNVPIDTLLDIAKVFNIHPSKLIDDERNILKIIMNFYDLEDKEHYCIEKDFELLMKIFSERYKKAD